MRMKIRRILLYLAMNLSLWNVPNVLVRWWTTYAASLVEGIPLLILLLLHLPCQVPDKRLSRMLLRASNDIHFRFRVRLIELASGLCYRGYLGLGDVVLYLLLDKVLLRMIRLKHSLPVLVLFGLHSSLVLRVFLF